MHVQWGRKWWGLRSLPCNYSWLQLNETEIPDNFIDTDFAIMLSLLSKKSEIWNVPVTQIELYRGWERLDLNSYFCCRREVINRFPNTKPVFFQARQIWQVFISGDWWKCTLNDGKKLPVRFRSRGKRMMIGCVAGPVATLLDGERLSATPLSSDWKRSGRVPAFGSSGRTSTHLIRIKWAEIESDITRAQQQPVFFKIWLEVTTQELILNHNKQFNPLAETELHKCHISLLCYKNALKAYQTFDNHRVWVLLRFHIAGCNVLFYSLEEWEQ